MKKLLIIITAMLGIFNANLLAQPANSLDGLKPWHQSLEQNVTAQLPIINKAFDGNIASSASIKLDSIIAPKSQLNYFTYDSLGHLLSGTQYSGWYSEKNVYTAGVKHLNSYTNGFLATQILKNYNYINKEWYFSYKAEFTNDAQGHQTSYILYNWNTTKSIWEAKSKYVYTYNPSGKNTLETDSVWNKTTSKFVNSNKYEFQYDANGNQTLQTKYEWNANSLKWSISYKNENTYNASGNITVSKKYSFSSNGSSYLSDQSEYIYDAGKLVSTTTYYGSYGSTTLTLITKVEYSYDANDNRTHQIDYNWNSARQVWDNSYKRVYSYDPTVNAANVVWSLSGVNWIKNKITSLQIIPWMIKQAGEQPQWYPQPVHQYYYSDYNGITSLVIEQTSTSNFNLCLYPNPFSTKTTIKYKVSESVLVSLKIFNALGTEVACLMNERKPVGEYSIEWNAAGFGSGIYFCRMQAGKYTNTKKLVLQK